MKRLAIYISIAVVSLSLYLWWYYQPERVLTRKLHGLVESLNFAPDSSRSARLMKSSSVTSYFADPVEITSPFEEATGSFTLSDLDSGYSYLAQSAREILIEPDDAIEIDLQNDHATLVFDAHVKVAINSFVKAVNGRYRITTHWKKTENGWQVHSSDWKEIP